ncbi:hypothetical protein AOL_s00076g500 [Orbilia oligospora ATCC 24927]|uniref:Uncharacterized protein n=1 Tax=Arthrobotrys oligospora (strain ATCC 24927 / CBS 115.81 / DSM 1491) TaxID=756982 RepID=G1XA42_ARTOA|nr:hypothetical protein AOL_s00076g500 [Orbilia oligospora ATCC 24927]EGX49859.1 hypothetical protein AOL_s00076g500 [Orbilia oligospora ATCC 24927]
MEKLEYLTLTDAPLTISSLPVEILRNIIDQVVLSTGFYAALEVRLVNKLFDIIVLDSVLDTDRDSHLDTGSLDITPDLAYTALYRRVVDTATRLPLLVSKIRSLTTKIHEYEPSLPIDGIREALCWTAILECGGVAIFNWRKGGFYTSINKKHDKINQEIQKTDKEDEKWMDWYLSSIYAYSHDFENLTRIYERAEEKGKPVDLDCESVVFGTIPIIAARYGTEEMAIWAYDHSTVCKPKGPVRQEFIRYTALFGRIGIMKHLVEEKGDRDEKYLAFTDTPKWATSFGQIDLLKWLIADAWMVFEDVSKEAKYIFLAACTHGNTEIARWIVEEEEFEPEPGEKTKSLRHGRPLCLATQSGNVDIVSWLLGLENMGTKDEMLLSFKWAMRYAGLDMVKLYFEKGLPIDPSQNDWVGGKVVKAAIDAGRKGRAEHLRWVMENGVVFKGGDEHAVVYKTAEGGSLKCLKVLRDLLEGYETIAKEEIQNAWDVKDRRAVETLLTDGVEKPKGFCENTLNGLKYQVRVVSTSNWSRKKWGYWPYLWNYSTHF